jgi:hypothetical protein
VGAERLSSGVPLSRRAVLVALCAALACSRGPSDPVGELLNELEAAAEEKDADRFGARVSEGFEGPRGLGRAEALATLRRYFAAYESVSLEVYGVEVERDAARAGVSCVVEFAGRARALGGLQGLLPPSAVYRFEMRLVEEEDGVWRVTRASWKQVPPDAAD